MTKVSDRSFGWNSSLLLGKPRMRQFGLVKSHIIPVILPRSSNLQFPKFQKPTSEVHRTSNRVDIFKSQNSIDSIFPGSSLIFLAFFEVVVVVVVSSGHNAPDLRYGHNANNILQQNSGPA